MVDSVRIDEEQHLGARGGVAAWCEYAAMRLLLGGASRMPRFLQVRLVDVLARIAAKIDKRHVDSARVFIGAALGEEAARDDERLVQAYRHIFQISLDAQAFERRVPQTSFLEHYDITYCEGFHEAVDAGRGGIAVTAHIGDWEAGSAIMPHVGLTPSYGVAKPPKNRYLSRHLLRVRERRRLTMVPRKGGMRAVASILEGGGWMGMLLDQRPSGKAVVANFFGRPARSERSAAVLIKRLRLPIIFVACYLTPRPFQYRLVFNRVIPPEELAKLSVEQVVALVNHEMEELIRVQPEQYFWLHDRYRDAPLDSPVPEVPEIPRMDPEAACDGSSGAESDSPSPEGRERPSQANSGR